MNNSNNKIQPGHFLLCKEGPSIMHSSELGFSVMLAWIQILVWWSYRWGETTLRSAATNKHIVHPPDETWAWRSLVEWYLQGKTPDSSTRALWQSYQQNHLVARQEILDERNAEFSRQIIFVHTCKWFFACRKILRHGADSFNSPLKEVVRGFLTPLKVHRLDRVWSRDPWVQ
jgi:hypothetical protein